MVLLHEVTDRPVPPNALLQDFEFPLVLHACGTNLGNARVDTLHSKGVHLQGENLVLRQIPVVS